MDKDWTLKKLVISSSLYTVYSKNPLNFNLDGFSFQFYVKIYFWFVRDVTAFESSIMFQPVIIWKQ